MLVLSRKESESIVIDGRIKVTVVEIRPGHVRLAFDAPSEVPIHREEVYRRLQREMQAENPSPSLAAGI